MTGTRRALVGFAAAALLAAAWIARDAERSAPDPTAGEGAAPAAAPAAPRPRLVDLGSDKCVPCRMMAPILEALRTDYADVLEVVVIDVRADPEAAREYGIRVIPTQVFYDAAGHELVRHEGFLSREDLLAAFADHGVRLPPRGPESSAASAASDAGA